MLTCSVVQVLVVGHDWGSIIGWYLCQLRPDRVKGYVAVAVPVIPRGPGEASWEQQWRSIVGDGFYICRFQVSMNSNALRLIIIRNPFSRFQHHLEETYIIH